MYDASKDSERLCADDVTDICKHLSILRNNEPWTTDGTTISATVMPRADADSPLTVEMTDMREYGAHINITRDDSGATMLDARISWDCGNDYKADYIDSMIDLAISQYRDDGQGM